jgi:hypothetical protein
VAADDLVGLVPREPLGPGIPGDHLAVHVEGDDGVIVRGADQQVEQLLAALRVVPHRTDPSHGNTND